MDSKAETPSFDDAENLHLSDMCGVHLLAVEWALETIFPGPKIRGPLIFKLCHTLRISFRADFWGGPRTDSNSVTQSESHLELIFAGPKIGGPVRRPKLCHTIRISFRSDFRGWPNGPRNLEVHGNHHFFGWYYC